MKKYLLTLLFAPLITSAQNWSLFNSVERFNYRLDDDNFITTTILLTRLDNDQQIKSVDISKLPDGIYIIELKCGTESHHRTLVKQ